MRITASDVAVAQGCSLTYHRKEYEAAVHAAEHEWLAFVCKPALQEAENGRAFSWRQSLAIRNTPSAPRLFENQQEVVEARRAFHNRESCVIRAELTITPRLLLATTRYTPMDLPQTKCPEEDWEHE